MKEKLSVVIDELEMIANFALYAAACGAAWELGKNLCNRLFR